MTDKPTQELKPCPFTGNPARVHCAPGSDGKEWYVGAPDGARLSRSFYTEAEAIAAWNTRSGDATELHPVLVEIMAEVEKATRKFPTWPTRIIDAGNVVAEEAGELSKACLQVTYEKHKETLEGVRTEAIQTAAMAFRFLCSMDRYDTTPAEQHEQNPLGAHLEGEA